MTKARTVYPHPNPVYAIDRFDIAYSILHVVQLALEADGAGTELSLLQMHETMAAALDMLVPIREAIDASGLELPASGGDH